MEFLEVFSARLKNARIMKGFSMDELAKSMKDPVSKMAISRFESGSLKPNSTTLINLSEALGVPVDYFFRPFEYSIKDIKFRKKTTLPAKKERAIKERISDIVERYSYIEELCNSVIQFKKLDGIVADYEGAKEAAKEIRRQWKLGNAGIVHVISMLEEHGVKVVIIDAPNSFDGMSAMINGSYPVLILNKDFNSERMRFTALHELGHIIMTIDNSLDKKQAEKICNTFASEMLIPEEHFMSLIGRHRRDISYNELAFLQMQFGISCDALMYKAKESQIISQQTLARFHINKNAHPDFKKRVEQSFYPKEEALRFERLVYQALSTDLISTSSAASILNIPVETVKRNFQY